MQWTPDKDQLLLILILENHKLSIDAKKVAEAWRAIAGDSAPTARAITERMHKIKKLAKGQNGAVSTPRKNGGNQGGTPKSGASAKRFMEDETPRKRTKASNSSPIKKEEATFSSDDGVDVENITPSKRVRKSPKLPPGLVTLKDEETDNDVKYESDGSEFVGNDSEDAGIV